MHWRQFCVDGIDFGRRYDCAALAFLCGSEGNGSEPALHFGAEAWLTGHAGQAVTVPQGGVNWRRLDVSAQAE